MHTQPCLAFAYLAAPHLDCSLHTSPRSCHQIKGQILTGDFTTHAVSSKAKIHALLSHTIALHLSPGVQSANMMLAIPMWSTHGVCILLGSLLQQDSGTDPMAGVACFIRLGHELQACNTACCQICMHAETSRHGHGPQKRAKRCC